MTTFFEGYTFFLIPYLAVKKAFKLLVVALKNSKSLRASGISSENLRVNTQFENNTQKLFILKRCFELSHYLQTVKKSASR